MRAGALLLAAGLLLYPIPQSLWALAAVIPLVPIGTALLFPATTSLMSRYSDARELGTTMGVAQTFAGLARVVAPLLATTIFQRLGHDWPFYLAGGVVALAGALTLQIPESPECPRSPRRRRKRHEHPRVSTDDRLDRLEQRLAVLETLVRQLAAGGVARQAVAPPPCLSAAGLAPAPPPAASPPDGGATGRRRSPSAARRPVRRRASRGRPLRRHRIGAPLPPRLAPRLPRSGRRRGLAALDSEQWIGQRVFLGIGVVALLMAAGYLLKLSFDRGWISPVMRCAGGVLAGLGVGALGWRLESRYRTYGAALVGAGAGIIYLSIWAASRLYGVLPSDVRHRRPGPRLRRAGDDRVRHQRRGARHHGRARRVPGARPARPEPDQRRSAPALPRQHGRRPGARRRPAALAPRHLGNRGQLLRRRHRSAPAEHAYPWGVLLFGLIGGTAGLYLGLRERWWETRLLTFSGGWTLLSAAGERIPQHWAVLAAGLVLSAPVWWHGLRRPQVFPLHLGPQGEGTGWSAGEALYFFVTPVLLG